MCVCVFICDCVCVCAGAARDYVRKCGALQFVLEMVYTERAQSTLQAALLALGCAVEKNGLLDSVYSTTVHTCTCTCTQVYTVCTFMCDTHVQCTCTCMYMYIE